MSYFGKRYITSFMVIQSFKNSAENVEKWQKLILAGESIVEIEEDVESLIKKSTYHNEVLQLYTFTGRDHVEDAQWIQKECAKYGIRVENNFLDIEELLEVSTIQKADMMHDSATISERIEDSLLYMFLTKIVLFMDKAAWTFMKSCLLILDKKN